MEWRQIHARAGTAGGTGPNIERRRWVSVHPNAAANTLFPVLS
jgi:hypothetical protein